MAAARFQLEAKITSATDLKNVNARGGRDLKPYALLWVEEQTKLRTYAAVGLGPTYRWDQRIVIPVTTPFEGSTLHIEILHEIAAEDVVNNPCAGTAELALDQLVREIGIGKEPAKRKLWLETPSKRPQGNLEISIRIVELGIGACEVDDSDFDEAIEY